MNEDAKRVFIQPFHPSFSTLVRVSITVKRSRDQGISYKRKQPWVAYSSEV